MTIGEALLVAAAGFAAGTLNAVGGGGSFVSFPAMVAAGLPSVVANASSTTALFPGSFASAYAYRQAFGPLGGLPLRVLIPISLAGGVIGAVLLLSTPVRAFDSVVPWLLLAATVIFGFGPRLSAILRRRVGDIGRRPVLVVQFLLGIYGGYFGGALGLMMMAVWSLFGVHDIRAMSAARTLTVGATNAVAVVIFIAAGTVDWVPTFLMMAAAIVGGYGGARLARGLDPALLRTIVNVMNVAVTAVFFWRAWA